MIHKLKLEDVLAAWAKIKPHIHKTPLLRSQKLSELLGCDLYIKAEFLQKTGSFKARGALHFLLAHRGEKQTYTTYSSGNHGQAVCWAARLRNQKAVIFMPEDASPAKVAAVRGYGGEARFAGRSSADRYEACRAYAEGGGAVIVPPYEHPWIMAGQGTVMLEVLEELPLFDAVLIPVGGGGLLSGNAVALKALRPNARIYACEPELANDAQRSLQKGRLETIPYPATIADGARNLNMGGLNWEVIRRTVTEGLVCSETRIRSAMGDLARYLKQVVEPTGCLTLACLWANRERFAGKTVVIYASGGNIGLADYAALLSREEADAE